LPEFEYPDMSLREPESPSAAPVCIAISPVPPVEADDVMLIAPLDVVDVPSPLIIRILPPVFALEVPDVNDSIEPRPLDPEPTATVIFPEIFEAVPVDTRIDPEHPEVATPDESITEPVTDAVGDDAEPNETAPVVVPFPVPL